jgi:hypothetical protein
MSPTILRQGPYRFFFNSREEHRVHVRAETPDGLAKFWLEPIVALAEYHGLSPQQLARLARMVDERQEEFRHAWKRHFSV